VGLHIHKRLSAVRKTDICKYVIYGPPTHLGGLSSSTIYSMAFAENK